MKPDLGPLLTGQGEMAMALAKALRIPIEANRVQGFELRVVAGQVATLRVTHWVDTIQAGDLATAFSTYQFELKQTDEQ